MAKSNNLTDFLTDVADGIRKRKRISGKINPQDFRAEIESIEGGGIDTSDATASASDILLGKTAYVNDEMVTGSIETYDYSVDDGGSSADLIEMLNNGTLTSYSNSNITKVRQYLFYSNSLVSVDLPNVVELQNSAFNNCKNLKHVNIPNITTIGNSNVFYGCESLISIELRKVTASINSVFQRCTNLTNVKLPLVDGIGTNCFANCTSLTDIYLGADKVVSLGATSVFSNAGTTQGYINVHVRAEYADQYASATNWTSLIADGTIIIVGDYKEE